MAQLQQINKKQLRDHIIDASHIDTTTTGKSLITKIVPGTGLILDSYTGADAGTGVVTLKLDDSLSSLASLTGTGFLIRMSNDRVDTRTIGFSNNLSVENQDGETGNPIFDLTDTGITAGTYKYLSMDAKGRAVSGFKYLQTWVANEVLLDTGDHTSYTLANAPVAGTLMLFMDGYKQVAGSDLDYTITGNTVTFTTQRSVTSIVSACYFWSENGTNSEDIQVEDLQVLNPAISMKRFRLAHIPQAGSQAVFLNGLFQQVGVNVDYLMEGQDIVFNYDTDPLDHVSVMYFR